MKFDEQTRESAAKWFAAMRRGPMPVEDRAAFDAWRADPVNQAALGSMHELWGETAGLSRLGVDMPSRRVRPRWVMAGGGLAAAAAASLALYLALPSGQGSRQSLATVIGEQRTTTMPDGSVISLNVATELAYDVGATRRRVALDEGEAVFFVRKDSARPFLVTAGDYEVRAVGTAFNVRHRNGSVDVAVMEGVVTIRALSGPRAGEEVARLPAGRRVALGPAASLTATAVSTVEVPRQSVAEWRVRTLDYEDVPVSRVIEDLNLFFERPIGVDRAALARRRITLRLQVEDRERALVTLAGLLEVRVRRGQRSDVLTERSAIPEA